MDVNLYLACPHNFQVGPEWVGRCGGGSLRGLELKVGDDVGGGGLGLGLGGITCLTEIKGITCLTEIYVIRLYFCHPYVSLGVWTGSSTRVFSRDVVLGGGNCFCGERKM